MKLLNLLFPENIKCITCNAELPYSNDFCLCDTCLKTLPFITGETCSKCGIPSAGGNYCLNCKREGRNFETHRSVFSYTGVVVNTIQAYKYSNAKYLAQYLGNLVVDKYIKLGWCIDVVIPVPLHTFREKERGYNQAYLLAKQFKNTNLAINTTALVRTKYVVQQARLTKRERIVNLKQSFKVVDKKAVAGKTVLLIDDIFTTGNTIDACANALIAGGVKKVYALTVCRTLLDD